MKISYLVLAHNNFIHLQRLINALNNSDTDFYIHIDKKTKNEFKVKGNNVRVLPEQFSINWAGFGMIEATLLLMKTAMTKSPQSDYYILISGVDYPIRPNSFLMDKLSTGKEFIDIAPIPVPYKPIERFEYFYFDYDRRNMKHYDPRFLTEVLLKKLKFKRNIPFQIYVGTQWFALTNGCVRYILQSLEDKPEYRKYFLHSLVPDESFFQTIIGNSPFAQNTDPCLTYTDWTVKIPPALISDEHIDLLKHKIIFDHEYGQSTPYFARKFDDNSLNIIQRIESELRR